mmetsp:Transcript_11329/g.26089  ORF Transcript_11329/g.26089 Transcript_11329/m.26089 type:complete len:302 (+) Transcript_11329:609-1514(+)
MTWLVPSPLRTTWEANSAVTSDRASVNSSSELVSSASSLESNTTVSDVDSSPSTLMALKVPATARFKQRCMASCPPSTLASVVMKTSIVAKFGSTIPAPLATPTMEPLPAPRSARATLAYLSVVMIALANGKAFWVSCSAASEPAARCAAKGAPTLEVISCTGILHPMMPVELGRTQSAPASRPSEEATAEHTLLAASTPAGPVATLLTLLLITTACKGLRADNNARPTTTGDPGHLFLVNTAAQAFVGLSSKITDTLIVPVAPGISTGLKSKVVTPTRKPGGKAPIVAKWSSHAACEANS